MVFNPSLGTFSKANAIWKLLLFASDSLPSSLLPLLHLTCDCVTHSRRLCLLLRLSPRWTGSILPLSTFSSPLFRPNPSTLPPTQRCPRSSPPPTRWKSTSDSQTQSSRLSTIPPPFLLHPTFSFPLPRIPLLPSSND